MSIFPIFYLWKQVTGSPGEPALQKSNDHEVEILGTIIQRAGHSWNEYIFRELSLDMGKYSQATWRHSVSSVVPTPCLCD